MNSIGHLAYSLYNDGHKSVLMYLGLLINL